MRHSIPPLSILFISFFALCACASGKMGAPAQALDFAVNTPYAYQYEVFVVPIIKSTTKNSSGAGVAATVAHEDSPDYTDHIGLVFSQRSWQILKLPPASYTAPSEPSYTDLNKWASDFKLPSGWSLKAGPIQGHCWQAGGWGTCPSRSEYFVIQYDSADHSDNLLLKTGSRKQTLSMTYVLTVQPKPIP